MKVLLLGGNGQLGSEIQRAFQNRPIELSALFRKDLDVSDAGAVEKALSERKFDVLLNCTSYHKTDEVESNAQLAAAINAHSVRTMARMCAQHRARFVHISTDYVFDGRATRPYVETDPIGPLNVYGATKAMGEALARLEHDDTLVFRTASLFGVVGASGKGGNFVETMIRIGREKGSLRIIADQNMSPTSAADLAAMILVSLENEIPAGIYHAVNSGTASWYEFASRIIDQAGVKATVSPIKAAEYPLPARRPAFSVLDNSKLAKLIGPISPWPDALDRYLRSKGHLAGKS